MKYPHIAAYPSANGRDGYYMEGDDRVDPKTMDDSQVTIDFPK